MEKVVLLLALLAVCLALIQTKPTPHRRYHRNETHCSWVRGRSCENDTDCACVNRHNKTLICNFEHKCEKRSKVDEALRRIMENQPCPRVFKKNCTVDADCPCSEHPLMCEDRECVKYRPFRRRNKVF